jgi:hypothetical protein
MVEVVEYPREVVERYVQERKALELRVAELEAALEAARVAVDALPFDAHEINCESLNPDPDCDGWCDCNVMSRIEKVRLALGLEVNNG